MSNVHLLYSKDITTQAMNSAILECIKKNKNMVYIISSYGLKSLRIDMNPNTLTDTNVMAFSEFESKAKRHVYKNGNYITRSDQQYLLNKIIEKNFQGTEQYEAFKSIRHDLFTLFDFLQFNDISPFDDAVLETIRQDYSKFEHDVFSLYGQFCLLIDNLIQSAQSEATNSNLADYGIRLLKQVKNQVSTLNEQMKAAIDHEISKGEAVFFDGFYLFTDSIKYTVESALRQGKDIYFIAKLDLTNYESSFIYEDNYKKLAKQYGKEIQTINLDADPYCNETALDYFRRVFPDSYLEPTSDEQQRIHDGSIEIIAPFVCREDEFAYVAKRISEYLKGLNTEDTKVLQRALENDIAVLIPVDWKRHSYMVKSALKKEGLFVLENYSEMLSEIDYGSIKNIYYSKADFMAETVKRKDGSTLNIQQKLAFFEKCYTGLSIKTSPRPISAYPVGQYIRQIYSFAVDGMNTRKFKLVLYSNWYYHTRQSDTRWDGYISDFTLIEPYFTDKSNIHDWIEEFDRLLNIKTQAQSDPLYLYHPLVHISNDSLAFLKQVTGIISEIMELIDFTGTIEEHVSTLINDVMCPFQITSADRDELQVEQVIICKLYEAAVNLTASALIDEIDTAYFAQNLVNMLEDYEREQIEEESGQYAFNIVSVENSKKYKQVFFVMAEKDKHPRNYKELFPYSKEIVEILTTEKYGICCKPAALHGLEYHILLNNHGYQNLFDFTTGKLVITHSKYEGKNQNAPSIYCEDIATAFGYELPELYIYPAVERQETNFEQKDKRIRLPKKVSYSLTELALFKLCPHLYLHAQKCKPFVYRDTFQLKLYFQSIVFVDLLRQFAECNLKHGKLYAAYDDEALQTLLEQLPLTIEKHFHLFSFIPKHEINDTISYIYKTAVDFVCYEVISRNSSGYFTIEPISPEIVSCNGYDLELQYDIIIKHGEKRAKTGKSFPDNRAYQSRQLIDFLTLHSKKENGDFLQHYADMINALNTNDQRQDRIKLASRMINKINAQFESGSVRFKKDGIERTDRLVEEIVDTNFLTVGLPICDYCRYCKVGGICKGLYINTRGDSYANR